MNITFITIHDLSDEATILYSSDSIVDVLGYTPDEVVGNKAWEFFNPIELETAKKVHKRSHEMDKASVLVYCEIKNRDGNMVRCECAFSTVYNVLVACTSIYQEGQSTAQRQADAPIVRRKFSSSPKDPRYHMLQHLSARFRQPVTEQSHEPRAALFLNRFTRTLTVMYATSGIEQIIGISAEDMKGLSFYYCIAEQSLQEAVRVLESAKGNDSIAYLRFTFRDPRQNDEPELETSGSEVTTDAEMTDAGEDDSPGDTSTNSASVQSLSNSDLLLELEAVVSCTSDGLVVCLRRARPHVPVEMHDTRPQIRAYPAQSYFAAPWGSNPIYSPTPPAGFAREGLYPGMPLSYTGMPSNMHSAVSDSDFLNSIRECGVFAWDLVGINGELTNYARGQPSGRAAPPDGPSVWDPEYKEEDEELDAGYATASRSNSG